jgi:Tfp pilus assembly protein PilN
LPWTVTAIVALASLLALIVIAIAAARTNAQVGVVKRDADGLEQQAAALRRRAEEIKNSLSPEQQRTLQAGHALIDRKQFSWSRLFADLEAVLPGGARVTRITVKNVSASGDRTSADLELAVISKSPTTVMEMISNMQDSGVFEAELKSQSLQKGRGEIGSEYFLDIRYTPRTGAPVGSEEQANRRQFDSSKIASDGGLR